MACASPMRAPSTPLWTPRALRIARDAGVKHLVLTHLVPSIPPTDAAEGLFTTGMSDVYKGTITVARDGMKIVP